MKKLVLLLLVVFVIATGCGKKEDKKDSSTETPTVPTTATQQMEDPNPLAWAEKAVFYEIFVRSFADSDGDQIGDFRGIANKVEYLKELGITGIWLMPMMDTTTYHGYDIVDYRAVNPDYGTMEDFKYMLQVCHDNGINVIIDFVVNHTSYQNQWFIDALADENSKYRDYYIISETKLEGDYVWRQDSATKLFYHGNYDRIMPDLNYSNPEVRNEIKDIAGYWLDLGVDGFRLDGAKHIDVDMEITHSWWKEFTEYVEAKNPSAFIVGENWDNDYSLIAPFYADMNSSFNFPLTSLLINMARGANIDAVSELKTMRHKYNLYQQSPTSVNNIMIDSTMLNNHDMNRTASTLTELGMNKIAASLLLTLPGTPFIYYGEELGQLGQGTDDNKREPFDWYKSAEGDGMTKMNEQFFNPGKFTIANDGISYEEEKDDSNSLFNHYKKFIAIRKENPVFATGKYETIGMVSGLYAYTVADTNSNEKLLVIHNQRATEQSFALKVSGYELVNKKDVAASDKFTLAGYETVIIKYSSDEAPLDTEYFKKVNDEKYTINIKVEMPANTPLEENIYIVGTFNEWNPGDENYILTRTSATTCEIQLSALAMSNMEYKFTRGDWDHREVDAQGTDKIGELRQQNRVYDFVTDGDTLNIVIEKWSDLQ